MPQPIPWTTPPRPLRQAAEVLAPALGGPPPVSETVEVSELVKLLHRHLRLVLTVAAFSFALGTAWAFLGHMRFASTARMYLGELEEKTRGEGQSDDDLGLSSGGQGDIASEIEILKSRSLVTRAILDAGLNVTVTVPGWKPPRYYRWLFARQSSALLDVASKELTAVDTQLSDRSASATPFEVTFVSDVDYEVRAAGQLVGHGKLGDPVECEGLSIRLMPGTARGPHSGARYEIEVDPVDGVVEAALRALDVATPTSKASTPGELVKIVNLTFSDTSPRQAASFLEHLMIGYLEERHAWKTQNATAAVSFLTGELSKTREKLDELQNNLATYRAKNGTVVLDGEAKGMIDQLGEYEEQRVAARMEVASLTSVNDQLRGPSPPVEAFMMGEAKDDAVLMGLATSLALSQQKLAEADARYNAPAPEVQNLHAQVESQLQSIRSYVRTRLNRSREGLRTLEGVVSQYQDKLRTVPSAEVGLAQLTRETEVYSVMYSQLLKRQQETALVKASSISKNRVLDPPEVPYREEMLRLGIGLGSAPAGLVFGVMLVLVRSLMSGRLQHSGDVRRHLGALPVLATIPHLAFKSDDLSPKCMEAFRTLRANVYGACHRDHGNVVLFTSPCSGDGKTTCARFLAESLARCGRSVLLVDTGLRRDSGADAVRPDKEVGLGDVLIGRQDWRDAVRDVRVSDGCLFHAILGGSDQSTNLLSSDAMFEFMAEAREAYDFIVLEAPSYPAVSDTVVLSTLADCVVAVLRLEHTSRSLAVDNFRQLSVASSNYAIVLNDVTS